MKLVLAWEGAGPAGPGDLVLSFSYAAGEAGAQAEADVQDADVLLTWPQRARIEDETSAVLARCRDALSELRVDGCSVFEASRYALRAEVSNLLRAQVVASGLAGRPGLDSATLAAEAACPACVQLGVQVGLGRPLSPPAPWRALEPPVLPGGGRDLLANLVARAEGAVRSPRRARVAVVPSMKAGAAIARSDVARLRAAGVALCLFPGLDLGGAARIGMRTRLPVVSARRPSGASVAPSVSSPPLHDVPELAAALALLVERVLGDGATLARHAAATLHRWERAMPEMRAVVLPTAASGAARLVIEWAKARELDTAVVQHGIYGFREVWGVDNDVDALLAWGPGVEEQAALWPAPRPAVEAVGAGDLSGRALPPSSGLNRILIATTNRPTGSALGLYEFDRAFLEDVSHGLQRLTENGVEVVLRPHPSEPLVRYELSAAQLGLDVKFSPPVPFVEALADVDLVVSSVSSVAFEAAALGRPVLLWNGRVPAEVRQRHLLPPFDAPRPGMFDDAAQFEALAAEPEALLEHGRELAAELARYAQPFDPGAFADAVERLSAD